MIYSVRGAIFTVVAAVMISGIASVNKSAKWAETKATIESIDRSCDFVETTYEDKRATSSHGYTDSCSSTDEFDKIKKKRNKMVSGRATVHVNYTAPNNGSYQTGKFTMNGGDDDFYTLKAGDSVEILVSKSDATKIRRS
jgi:Neuraminidase (sialidase)